MAYQVLLVDDELPALRFIQSIIEKYAPDFQVTHTCPSGEKAYEYLQSHAVDVLITDIAMQRMNGIELAKLARRLQQDIHIVVISGYAEFEFAQGAIQAAVDDYILKPVGISQMKQVLSKLKSALDEEHSSHAAVILPAIACDLPFSKEDIVRYYAHQDYRFAPHPMGRNGPAPAEHPAGDLADLSCRQALFLRCAGGTTKNRSSSSPKASWSAFCPTSACIWRSDRV